MHFMAIYTIYVLYVNIKKNEHEVKENKRKNLSITKWMIKQTESFYFYGKLQC